MQLSWELYIQFYDKQLPWSKLWSWFYIKGTKNCLKPARVPTGHSPEYGFSNSKTYPLSTLFWQSLKSDKLIRQYTIIGLTTVLDYPRMCHWLFTLSGWSSCNNQMCPSLNTSWSDDVAEFSTYNFQIYLLITIFRVVQSLNKMYAVFNTCPLRILDNEI